MCLHKSQSLDRQAALLKDLADHVVILQRCACFALNGIDGVAWQASVPYLAMFTKGS